MAHGIGARRHPDFKVQHAAITSLHRRIQELNEAKVEAAMADYEAHKGEPDPNGPDAVARRQAIFDDPKFDTRPLYDEARTIGRAVAATNLYRYDGGTLSVRFDKVGKAAWRKEFERLGLPLPADLG